MTAPRQLKPYNCIWRRCLHDPSKFPPCMPSQITSLHPDFLFVEDPLAGAVGTRFGRNVPMAAVQPDLANLLHPNPLLVSAKLLQRPSRAEYSRVPFLNVWAGTWIQFVIHDCESVPVLLSNIQ